MTVIKIIERADGGPCAIKGHYVKSMDFEAFNGRGHLVATPHRSRAMQFKEAVEAIAFWSTVSKTVPTRTDGKPNKPLTAYTVEIER